MSDEAVVVPENYPAKRRAVFVALTFYAQPYIGYDEPGTPDEFRNSSAMIPMVLMSMRWDGRLGFVGGFVENGIGIRDTIRKELAEEAGLTSISQDFRLNHVISHYNEKSDLCVSLYHIRDQEVKTMDEVGMMLVKAIHAKHFLSEGVIVPVHLKDYGRGKGLPALLKNNLAFAVKEELEELVKLVPCPSSTELPSIVRIGGFNKPSTDSSGSPSHNMRYAIVNLMDRGEDDLHCNRELES